LLPKELLPECRERTRSSNAVCSPPSSVLIITDTRVNVKESREKVQAEAKVEVKVKIEGK
jgi:hypothetical protein